MGHTIMERVSDMLRTAGGAPTGVGGSIVEKINQVINFFGGEVHEAYTIEEAMRELNRVSHFAEGGDAQPGPVVNGYYVGSAIVGQSYTAADSEEEGE